MNAIDQMWTRLAQHQPEADRLGYGEAWRRMCEERTKGAAGAADAAAEARAADAAAWAAEAAAWAADSADAAVVWAADAAVWAERAIDYVAEAEGKK